MDIMGLLIPMLSSSPLVKTKIENIFGQPVDHVSRCVSQFLDGIKSGPGVIDKLLQKRQRFLQVYQAGLRMGYQDWLSLIAAADCAGYPIIDVANSFALRRGWLCSVDLIQLMHSKIMPGFMEKGRKIGLFQADKPKAALNKGIPAVQVKSNQKDPPWRTSGVANSAPPLNNKPSANERNENGN